METESTSVSLNTVHLHNNLHLYRFPRHLQVFEWQPKLVCWGQLNWVFGRLEQQKMTSFLTAFNAQLTKHLEQLQTLQEKNDKQKIFQPTFWMQQVDFDVAREVFVAVDDGRSMEL